MLPWQRFANGWLWRPLLDVPRASLLSHARAKGLRWIDDPSNEDTALDRNFLPHSVLPLLRERWTADNEAPTRSAALSSKTRHLLAAVDEQSAAADLTTAPQVQSTPTPATFTTQQEE